MAEPHHQPRLLRVGLAALGVVTLFAVCDDGEEGDADGDADADADADADTDADGDEARLQLGFDLTLSGRGSVRVGEADLVHGVGEIDLAGLLPALAYEMQDWTEASYTLYFVLAPESDDLNVLYVYCGYAAEDGLDYFWHESFTATMDYEVGLGTCRGEARDVVVTPGLVSLEGAPAAEDLLQGVSVAGAGVTIEDGGGAITLGGEEMEAWPFELVDCSEVCAVVPEDGWWEVHLLLTRAGVEDPCFGVLYLFVDGRTEVLFAYGICLASLSRIADEELTAAWAMDRSTPRRAEPPPGPFDPVLGHVLRPCPGCF
jgi:hypothetical protein